MQRNDMRDWLNSLDPADRYPLWVISYNRPGTAPLLNTIQDEWVTAGDVNVLVRKSQEKSYREAYPRLAIRSLPDEMIGSCGEARWGAADMARVFGQGRIIQADDDVLKIRFLFERAITRGPNKGKPCSGHNTVEDLEVVPNMQEKILAAVTSVAEEAFAAHPGLVTGGIIKQHMSFSNENHHLKYVVNGKVTPRQLTVWELDRLEERGIRLNQELFGVHGEDIGLAAEILKAGADIFAIPSFVYDHWPEAVNIHRSAIRNPENAARLHAEEWDALQQYPIKDYLRAKRSVVDGSYEWGDVNWVALNKLRGTKTIKVPWDPVAYESSLLI